MSHLEGAILCHVRLTTKMYTCTYRTTPKWGTIIITLALSYDAGWLISAGIWKTSYLLILTYYSRCTDAASQFLLGKCQEAWRLGDGGVLWRNRMSIRRHRHFTLASLTRGLARIMSLNCPSGFGFNSPPGREDHSFVHLDYLKSSSCGG